MFLTCHHIIPREDGGLNEGDNLIALCRSCHNEIEDLGYRTRAEIKRHTLAAKVLALYLPSATMPKNAKRRRARAEREEAEEVFEWAAKWGEGFWGHVPYIKLGDPVPRHPEMVFMRLRRGTPTKGEIESTMPLTLRQKDVTEL